jgi:hypothetical protein
VNHRIPTERSFGRSLGLACALISGLTWWLGHDSIAIVLLVLAMILLGAALVAPAALRVPNLAWWRLAQLLGWINTRVILTVFFIVVIVPVGFVMRLFGRNPLRPPQATTTWSAYSTRRCDPKHYDHMF